MKTFTLIFARIKSKLSYIDLIIATPAIIALCNGN